MYVHFVQRTIVPWCSTLGSWLKICMRGGCPNPINSSVSVIFTPLCNVHDWLIQRLWPGLLNYYLSLHK